MRFTVSAWCGVILVGISVSRGADKVPLLSLQVKSKPAGATRTACSYVPVVFSVKNSGKSRQAVDLTASGSAKTFRDPQCTDAMDSFSAPVGTVTRSVYVKDEVAETVRIVASGANEKVAVTLPIYGATSVSEFGASGADRLDDSAAFAAALASAAKAARDFPAGPPLDSEGTTRPQSIVYVPAGTYYLSKIVPPSEVRIEIDAHAVLRGGAIAGQKCQNLFLLDTPNSSTKLASAEPPITNVSIVGVGTTSEARESDADFDVSHSFTLDDDPTHQICGWKTNGDGSLATAGVIPPMIMVRNVTGFLFENFYSVQSYDPYPLVNGYPKNYPANVIVFQSAVGGNYNLVKGAGGTTNYRPNEQTPVSEFTHPRFGIYRNHVNVNAPAGYGPAQFQSGENLVIDGMYSRGGVALRLETDVAGNGLDPDSDPKSPCKNYGGSGPDYRCYAWGAKLDKIQATRIRCVNGNAGVYLAAHGQLNGTVDVSDVQTENCYSGISESANSADASKAGDPHLLVGSFSPTFSGVEIVGSSADKNGKCLFDGCLAQKPCSQADTWIANVIASESVSISDSASWGVMPVGLDVSGSFGNTAAACPK